MAYREYRSVMSLEKTIILFMAKNMWEQDDTKKMIQEQITTHRDFRDAFTITCGKVVELVREKYHNTPNTIRNQIIKGILLIGHEVFEWIVTSLTHKPITSHFQNICYQKLQWSSYFFCDPVKSACLTKKFDVNSEKLCECCFKNYIKDFWTPYQSRLFSRFFGKHTDHAITYIVCLLKEGTYGIDTFFCDNPSYYEIDKHLVNVLKISVSCGYHTGAIRYWFRMTDSQKKNNIISIVKNCLTKWPEYLYELPRRYWITFAFLWNQLDSVQKKQVLQSHSIKVHTFLSHYYEEIL